MTPRFLLIGRISAPHGIRGELRVHIMTDDPNRFSWLKTVHISPHENGDQMQEVAVTGTRMHKKNILLRLEDVITRNDAELLRTYWLFVPEEDAIPLEAGEFYLHQLIDLTVVTDEGETLGTLVDVIETKANHVYVVDGSNGELLLPAIPEVILDIDFDRSQMTVFLLPGLR